MRNQDGKSLGQLAIESGYAPSVGRRPRQVTNTKAYKIAFALENKEIVDKIDRDIARFQEALVGKNLKKEETRVIVSSLDTLIKNKQLLSGNATANVGVNIAISEHIAEKYNKSAVDVNSENGSTEP